jgi:hypothetical protein
MDGWDDERFVRQKLLGLPGTSSEEILVYQIK